MILLLIFLVVGLIILAKSADILVDGATNLARKYHLPELTIGLTIIAFGTSAPELVVNGISSYNNHPDIVFGNILGSNIFNLLLILGIASIITPLKVSGSTVWKEIPFSLISIIIVFILANDILIRNASENSLSNIDGIILLIFFLIFLYYVFVQMKKDPLQGNQHEKVKIYGNFKIWAFILSGLTGLIIGGKITVESAVSMAEMMHVSEKVISLTIIAAGTSLPELATSIVAALKKKNDIAVGNVVGSNLFNIFFILGLSSVIRPMEYSLHFNTEMYLLFGGSAFLLFAMFAGEKGKLERWEGMTMVIIFLLYSAFLIVSE